MWKKKLTGKLVVYFIGEKRKINYLEILILEFEIVKNKSIKDNYPIP